MTPGDTLLGLGREGAPAPAALSLHLCLPLFPVLLGPRAISQSREADLVTRGSSGLAQPYPGPLGKMSHFSSPEMFVSKWEREREGGAEAASGPPNSPQLRGAPCLEGRGSQTWAGQNPQLWWASSSPWAESCWTQKAGRPSRSPTDGLCLPRPLLP